MPAMPGVPHTPKFKLRQCNPSGPQPVVDNPLHRFSCKGIEVRIAGFVGARGGLDGVGKARSRGGVRRRGLGSLLRVHGGRPGAGGRHRGRARDRFFRPRHLVERRLPQRRRAVEPDRSRRRRLAVQIFGFGRSLPLRRRRSRRRARDRLGMAGAGAARLARQARHVRSEGVLGSGISASPSLTGRSGQQFARRQDGPALLDRIVG